MRICDHNCKPLNQYVCDNCVASYIASLELETDAYKFALANYFKMTGKDVRLLTHIGIMTFYEEYLKSQSESETKEEIIMEMEKGKQIAQLVNQIQKLDEKIDFTEHKYPDEFFLVYSQDGNNINSMSSMIGISKSDVTDLLDFWKAQRTRLSKLLDKL